MRRKIISFNFNGWKPVANVKFATKIVEFAKYIKGDDTYQDADIIALQEFISGGGKYLSQLEDAFNGEYIVLTPPDFNYTDHPRSIMNVILLRKSTIKGYRVEQLPSVLPNRLLLVSAFFDDCSVKIMNTYQVQIQNFKGHNGGDAYVKKRIEQHNQLWDETVREATKIKDEQVVILGDFQESSEGEHIKELFSLGYVEKVKNIPTVRGDFFAEQCIDHIIYSKSAWDIIGPKSYALSGGLLDEISDHSMLVAW